jgi:hypothetical protein
MLDKDWETCLKSPLLWTLPNAKYPSEELTENNYLLPFQLSYDLLRNAVKKAHCKLISSQWTSEEAKQFLWVFGLNNEATCKVIEHAMNEKIFNYTAANRGTLQREYSILCRHKERFPLKYQQWPYPALWTRGTRLQQHVDVPKCTCYFLE